MRRGVCMRTRRTEEIFNVFCVYLFVLGFYLLFLFMYCSFFFEKFFFDLICSIFLSIVPE